MMDISVIGPKEQITTQTDARLQYEVGFVPLWSHVIYSMERHHMVRNTRLPFVYIRTCMYTYT